MGQVWSKADFDGINEAGYEGGRGSPLAVTAQNAGPDGIWDTSDDLNTPLNFSPADVSIDNSLDATDNDPLDRVRGFYSFHPQGANFSFADGSVRYISEIIDARVYRGLSTSSGREVVQID